MPKIPYNIRNSHLKHSAAEDMLTKRNRQYGNGEISGRMKKKAIHSCGAYQLMSKCHCPPSSSSK